MAWLASSPGSGANSAARGGQGAKKRSASAPSASHSTKCAAARRTRVAQRLPGTRSRDQPIRREYSRPMEIASQDYCIHLPRKDFCACMRTRAAHLTARSGWLVAASDPCLFSQTAASDWNAIRIAGDAGIDSSNRPTATIVAFACPRPEAAAVIRAFSWIAMRAAKPGLRPQLLASHLCSKSTPMAWSSWSD